MESQSARSCFRRRNKAASWQRSSRDMEAKDEVSAERLRCGKRAEEERDSSNSCRTDQMAANGAAEAELHASPRSGRRFHQAAEALELGNALMR